MKIKQIEGLTQRQAARFLGISSIMINSYTVYKKFIIFSLVFATVLMLCKYLIKGWDLFTVSVGFLLYVFIGLVTFNQYKIEICNDRLIFYKLFKKPISIIGKEITEICIEKIDVPNRFTGQVRDLVIHNNKEVYKINIRQLENDEFYLDMLDFTQRNNILNYNRKNVSMD